MAADPTNARSAAGHGRPGGVHHPVLVVLPAARPHNVTLIATPDANQGTAVAVDIVLITDEVAAKQIGALSASNYFTQRTQLEHDFPNGFVVRSWGLAPGQVARGHASANPTCNRASTLLFARYATPGDHRQVLGTSNIVVTLGDSDFSIAP